MIKRSPIPRNHDLWTTPNRSIRPARPNPAVPFFGSPATEAGRWRARGREGLRDFNTRSTRRPPSFHNPRKWRSGRTSSPSSHPRSESESRRNGDRPTNSNRGTQREADRNSRRLRSDWIPCAVLARTIAPRNPSLGLLRLSESSGIRFDRGDQDRTIASVPDAWKPRVGPSSAAA